MLENGYGIMPNDVLFDKALSSTAKLVFCYISSLCAKRGYCWASNDNIASKFGINKTTASTIINQLGGYLSIEISGTKRTITLLKNQKHPFEKSKATLLKNQNIIVQDNNTNRILKTKAKEKLIDKKADELAKLMATLVAENYAFAKTDPIKWAIDIDKLNRIDQHDWGLIEFIIRWACQDDFWKQNIRSGSKLRQQFETLMVRAKGDLDKRQQNRVVSV